MTFSLYPRSRGLMVPRPGFVFVRRGGYLMSISFLGYRDPPLFHGICCVSWDGATSQFVFRRCSYSGVFHVCSRFTRV